VAEHAFLDVGGRQRQRPRHVVEKVLLLGIGVVTRQRTQLGVDASGGRAQSRAPRIRHLDACIPTLITTGGRDMTIQRHNLLSAIAS
jgi:hypothetical protein